MGVGKRILSGMLGLILILANVLSLHGLEARAEENTILVSGDYQYIVNEDGNSVSIERYLGRDVIIQ